jgi:hypothetical protein
MSQKIWKLGTVTLFDEKQGDTYRKTEESILKTHELFAAHETDPIQLKNLTRQTQMELFRLQVSPNLENLQGIDHPEYNPFEIAQTALKENITPYEAIDKFIETQKEKGGYLKFNSKTLDNALTQVCAAYLQISDEKGKIPEIIKTHKTKVGSAKTPLAESGLPTNPMEQAIHKIANLLKPNQLHKNQATHISLEEILLSKEGTNANIAYTPSLETLKKLKPNLDVYHALALGIGYKNINPTGELTTPIGFVSINNELIQLHSDAPIPEIQKIISQNRTKESFNGIDTTDSIFITKHQKENILKLGGKNKNPLFVFEVLLDQIGINPTKITGKIHKVEKFGENYHITIQTKTKQLILKSPIMPTIVNKTNTPPTPDTVFTFQKGGKGKTIKEQIFQEKAPENNLTCKIALQRCITPQTAIPILKQFFSPIHRKIPAAWGIQKKLLENIPKNPNPLQLEQLRYIAENSRGIIKTQLKNLFFPEKKKEIAEMTPTL